MLECLDVSDWSAAVDDTPIPAEGLVCNPTHHHAPGTTSVLSLCTRDRTQFLENRITGELVLINLEERMQPWSLDYHDGFGFITREGSAPRWANNIFRMTVWDVNGLMLVKTVMDDGSQINEWLHDARKKCKTLFTAWAAEFPIKAIKDLEVLQFRHPRDGASFFVNMKQLQEHAEFETKFARHANWFVQMKPTWLGKLEMAGCSAEHFYVPVRGNTVADVRLDSAHASIAAAIVVFMNGYVHTKKVADRQACRRAVLALINHFCGNSFEFLVDVNLRDGVRFSDTVHTGELVKVEDGKLTVCPRDWQCNVGQSFFDFVYVARLHPNTGYLYSQLVNGLGHIIEQKSRHRTLCDDPLKHLSAGGRPSSRTLRSALAALSPTDARNASAASRVLRRCGFAATTHKAWVDDAYVRRYLFSSRFNLGDGLSYGVTLDKGRRVGKDWLRGTLMSYEKATVSVLAPMAPFGILFCSV